MNRLLGGHPIDTGGIDQAVRRAGEAGMATVQIFTAIPKYYGDRSSIRPERVERFGRALKETGIEPRHVLVHAAYVLNTASAEPEKAGRARAGLAKEMERSIRLGVGQVCFHPGAATDGDREAALERVAGAITFALESTSGTTRLLVENTAGAGMTIGRTPDEVGGILSRVPSRLRPRTGYGLDTCHLFAAGHDISRAPEALRDVLDAFEDAAGEPPAFFHLNDSEGTLGSNRDRHALIGEGRIGTAPFGWLLHDDRSAGVPLILETPQQVLDVTAEDTSPDPYDVRMMELLRRLEREED